MTSFIFNVLSFLKKESDSLSDLTFIIPNKRAKLFLNRELSKIIEQPLFSPKTISIEEFVEDLSELKAVSNIELLFHFYDVYTKHTNSETLEPFGSFIKWAQILIQDFNEIDRELIPQKNIFNYLSAIKDIEHWSLQDNKTGLVKNYLSFWNKLYLYYKGLTKKLLQKNIGYQGLMYRQAIENLETYIQTNKKSKHVFLGFNALNRAEEVIFQELLQNEMADVFWDIDKSFLEEPTNNVGLFIKRYKKEWHYYRKNKFKWLNNSFLEEKDINVYGVSGNIGQVKQIGSLLNTIAENKKSLHNTALILGDEKLLIPVLNALPKAIDSINITMGLPLKRSPIASLFESLFNNQKNASQLLFYKNVIVVLSHEYIQPLFKIDKIDLTLKIISVIKTNNITYLSLKRLKQIAPQFEPLIDLLFKPWKSVTKAIQSCIDLVYLLKQNLDRDKTSNLLTLEYLFQFNSIFNTISQLNNNFSYISDIKSLYSIYNDLLNVETLNFQGEPLEGLQIMGMLESRVLDFETVIIASVNEGVLPAGKTQNSFIPYDVKLENKLPTYKEKDAIYAYHFYRLLYRSKTVHIIYNTKVDTLTTGEKSRFILQLEYMNYHNINHALVDFKIPKIAHPLKIINKTEDVISKLQEIAKNGFSPSSLSMYIRNPIDFYYKKILDVNPQEQVEETIAAHHLGSIIHNTLEDLYKPIAGKQLKPEMIKDMTTKIDTCVERHFKTIFKEGDISRGKNLIVFEITKHYIHNALNHDLNDLKQGNTIKIIAVELEQSIALHIPELDFEINLTGKIDRIDLYNDSIRIIDYKTGRVDQNQVEIAHWETLCRDYNKSSKSFQLLCYAYLLQDYRITNFSFEAGIISFKNLNAGLLKFSEKKVIDKKMKKQTQITQITLDKFFQELKRLIQEICNPSIPFIEKEI